MACFSTYAQSPIVVFSAGYVAGTTTVTSYTTTPAPGSSSFSACSSANFNYTYNNGTGNNLRLTGIVTNGRNYFIAATASTVKLRRVNNSNATGNRSVLFLESATGPTASCPGNSSFGFKSPYQDDMEAFLNINFINQGTDNLFTNMGNGDGNMNNIERVDVINVDGLATSTPANAGFAVLDRGNNNGHDVFRIAAILRLDVNGNPDSFGVVKTCTAGNGSNNGSWGHPSTTNGNVTIAGYVLRKEEADAQLRASTALNQQLGGVFFSFADLEIAPYQEFYGYALLAPDGIANATSARLLDMNDTAVYPINTTEPSGGGLDLITVTATFVSGPLVSMLRTELTPSSLNNRVSINWSVTGIQPLTTVQLQVSENGTAFAPVYSEIAGGQFARGEYREQGNAGYFYRLKIIFPDGHVYYGRTIRTKSTSQPACRVYPGLIGILKPLIVEGLKDGAYQAQFINVSGQVKTISCIVVNGKAGIILPGSLSRGLYFVKFVNVNSQRFDGGTILVQ